jgi:hypothetical protein
VDFIRDCLDKGFEEGSRRMDVGAFFESCEGEFGCSVDADKEAQFAFGGLNFGNIDVEEADRTSVTQIREDIRTVDIVARSSGSECLDSKRLTDLTFRNRDGQIIPVNQSGMSSSPPRRRIKKRPGQFSYGVDDNVPWLGVLLRGMHLLWSGMSDIVLLSVWQPYREKPPLTFDALIPGIRCWPKRPD